MRLIIGMEITFDVLQSCGKFLSPSLFHKVKCPGVSGTIKAKKQNRLHIDIISYSSTNPDNKISLLAGAYSLGAEI